MVETREAEYGSVVNAKFLIVQLFGSSVKERQDLSYCVARIRAMPMIVSCMRSSQTLEPVSGRDVSIHTGCVLIHQTRVRLRRDLPG
jgi:hypothetical protein